MATDKTVFRYNERAQAFDEDLEETLSSFKSEKETKEAEKKASEPFIDYARVTAGDEVSALANAPVDSNKVAFSIFEYDFGKRLQKMAEARPRFIHRFLEKSAEAPTSGAMKRLTQILRAGQ